MVPQVLGLSVFGNSVFGVKKMYKEIFFTEIPSCVCCDLNDKETYICTFIPPINHLHNWLGKLGRALF